ncbi:MAG: hypothetical protein HC831_16275 [Chloroflexia bacterium]|nr:hypothetical protein [Chloroflexia bacterium]
MKNIKLSGLSGELRNTEWMKGLLNVKGVNGYLVGGIVRDAFIGKKSKDIDLVFEGISIPELKAYLDNFGFVKLNNVGDRFQVLKFRPKGWGGEDIDVATPRKDIKTGKGHTGFKHYRSKQSRKI